MWNYAGIWKIDSNFVAFLILMSVQVSSIYVFSKCLRKLCTMKWLWLNKQNCAKIRCHIYLDNNRIFLCHINHKCTMNYFIFLSLSIWIGWNVCKRWFDIIYAFFVEEEKDNADFFKHLPWFKSSRLKFHSLYLVLVSYNRH